MLKNLLGGLLLALFLTGCTLFAHAPAPLTYHAGQEVYILEKSCVNQVTPSEYGDGVWLKINNSHSCSARFEQFFSAHIGKKLKVSFNHKSVTNPTNIVSPIRLQQGLHQHINQSADATATIAYYQSL